MGSDKWTRQRLAWQRVRAALAPLAHRGAWLPSAKARKWFRRHGLWDLPSFNPRTLAPSDRLLLAPTGQASQPEALGPAGRRVWVRLPGDATADLRAAAASLCQIAEQRCGLSCTLPKPRPGAGTLSGGAPPLPWRDTVLTLVRLRTDHDLVLRFDSSLLLSTGQAPPTDVWVMAPDVPGVVSPARAVVRLLPNARLERQPLFRATLGLRLQVQKGAPLPLPAPRLAEALCRLGDRLPDHLLARWDATPQARKRRSDALARWLGLRFVDRPVLRGRPPLERRYIHHHYRGRVFNLRRRTPDGAYLIAPRIVVLHHTGSTDLRSALYTLRSPRLGRRGRLQNPRSLGVGVPYLVSRTGTIYRLFAEDRRFGRHTIGLNHSAVGIENVGDQHHPMTAVQVERDAQLVRFLALRYPLRYLIGHREVYQMARTPYYLEAEPGYCTSRRDPTLGALRAVRARVGLLGLAPPPSDRPLLRSCPAMFHYFKQIRAHRRRPRPRLPQHHP